MRLQRRGKTGYATFRVVVAEQRAPIKGRSVADLGSYNPHTNAFAVNKEQVELWLGKGVQPSATVHNLLVTHGLLKADKVTSWKPKKRENDQSVDEAKTPAAAESEGQAKPATKEAAAKAADAAPEEPKAADKE
jgi:small subunit ribosomal protein S16